MGDAKENGDSPLIGICSCLITNVVVYGMTPNPDTGRLLNPHLWKSKEVVVPKGD